MKNIKLIFALVVLSMTVALSGCTKETTTPDSGTRSAFLGKWSVSETYTKLSYEVTISADPNSTNGVFISNFAMTGSSSVPASAEINGSSIVLDANQVIGTGLTVNGNGNLSGTKINWNYTILDGATLFNAIAIYTKQ
ncbi:MAG: hypothetical protein WCK09_19600 [Bacteroidota bacterium]